MTCFWRFILAHLYPSKTMPTPIEDLNQSLADQSNLVTQLTNAANDLQTATNGVISRVAALPTGGPDLSAAIQAVNNNNSQISAANALIVQQTLELNQVAQ